MAINLMLKNVQYDIRDFINRATGQDDLIAKYIDAIATLHRVHDESSSREYRVAINAQLYNLTKNDHYLGLPSDHNHGAKIDLTGARGINPYKPFQCKLLRGRLELYNQMTKVYGINR